MTPPEVTVFPKEPVELGQPNILICHVDKFFPPVLNLNITWLRNGQPVTEGVAETIFLPSTEFLFHKFHYLPFLPMAEDVYDCKVEHWGLDRPLLEHWEAQEPTQLPETMEAVVCALGLAVGLVGVIAVSLALQARPSDSIPGLRGPHESSQRGDSLSVSEEDMGESPASGVFKTPAPAFLQSLLLEVNDDAPGELSSSCCLCSFHTCI
ncbi:RLA class II histocompatibility antigen, DP alpha-1 chain-like [Tupaia chinensis]|uniref:RLA class II histocompatibility antigen, DP alpha-1 chain-like n=1 Tax=Tupaia chinensis TaxID=246437 RepID=UPI000FFC0653|nr:RLA class II histocompatibility antigen, DP alpha-1 chain-like [Tupaia chinensis]